MYRDALLKRAVSWSVPKYTQDEDSYTQTGSLDLADLTLADIKSFRDQYGTCVNSSRVQEALKSVYSKAYEVASQLTSYNDASYKSFTDCIRSVWNPARNGYESPGDLPCLPRIQGNYEAYKILYVDRGLLREISETDYGWFELRNNPSPIAKYNPPIFSLTELALPPSLAGWVAVN